MPTSEFTFDNPPIDEVVVAAYFAPPVLEFQSQHVGLFWDRIKDRFPAVNQQEPIIHQLGPLGMAGVMSVDEPVPMPRYCFLSADEVNVVQVQKDAFLFNWRKRNGNLYPGFRNGIKPTFDRLYDEFEAFLLREAGVTELSVALCELSYVDIIERCDYWQGPRHTHNVIPAFSNPLPDFEGAVENDFDCSYVYYVEEDFTIFVRIRTLVHPERIDQPLLTLEMKASNQFGGVQRRLTDGWFERAHDTLFREFINLTDKQVQRDHWGMRTGSTK